MDLLAAAARRMRRAAAADGAGSSGLSAVLGVHALHAAGDALVGVALAGTLFFSVPVGQARGRIALYLVLTLLPFSVLVPVAGPLLDHWRHGRRNVMAVATGGRGLLTWAMAGATTSLSLYPLALAVLVLSRAYGLARSAAMPRVRPAGMGLVQANARLNVAAVSSSSAAAAVGAVVARLAGVDWVLYGASVVLVLAGVRALRLPAHVDEPLPSGGRRSGAHRLRLRDSDPAVLRAIGGAAALRAGAGLLTIFLAFLLRAEHARVPVIAGVVGAAAVGQLVGTLGAAKARRLSARALTGVAPALSAVACLAAAVEPSGAWPAVAAGVTGLVASASKFGLDASVQTHIPAGSVSTAFARSETMLQVAWVLGASMALVLPGSGSVGFAFAAALSAAGVAAPLVLPR